MSNTNNNTDNTGRITMNTEDRNYVFECPHCSCLVVVKFEETNCCIFRHAVFKQGFNQINPHTSLSECQNLVMSDKIYGCGKPFRLIKNSSGTVIDVVKCDYI